jgi:ferredoxin-thioredoxin reductase catalytic chain
LPVTDSMPSKDETDARLRQLGREAEAGGYHLNPDREMTPGLVRGLIVNDRRYGYPSCPCRLARGRKELDLDIICPCDYRDPDLAEFGMCYCALYVSEKVLDGTVKVAPIPERRPSSPETTVPVKDAAVTGPLPYPVLRCRVCGYLCARHVAPDSCPICGAKKDRFERFLL